MTIIARGRKPVLDLERALGGKRPPMSLVKQTSKELSEQLLLEAERRRAERTEIRKATQAAARGAFSAAGIADLRDDRSREAALKKIRAVRSRRRRATPPSFPELESHVDTGSMTWFKVPPYDDSWTNSSGSYAMFNQGAKKDTGEMFMSLDADTSDMFYENGGTAMTGLGMLFYSSQYSPNARFSAFTWRQYKLHAWAFGFDYSEADYKIAIWVDWLTGENAGERTGTIVASDSTWSTFFVDGSAENELNESFHFDFPLFADSWTIVYVVAQATASGENASSFIDLRVPFVTFNEP